MSHVLGRSALRTLVPLLALGLVVGCASGTAEGPAPVPAPEASRMPADLTGPFSTMAAAAHEQATEGEADWALFQNSCGQCHSLLPPAKAAPPMAVVMRQYARRFATPEEARAAMVFWVRNASAEWSAMPGAVQDHGVMPAQPLSPEDAERVVDYLLGLRNGEGEIAPAPAGASGGHEGHAAAPASGGHAGHAAPAAGQGHGAEGCACMKAKQDGQAGACACKHAEGEPQAGAHRCPMKGAGG